LTKDMGLDLYDGVGNWVGQVPVDEQVAPNSFTEDGVAWENLGSFKLTNNIFHISTWNSSTDGAICVNGIQLQAVPVVDDSDVTSIVGGQGVVASSGTFTTTGSWTTSTQGAFDGSHTSSSTPGTSSSKATWTMPVTPGQYEVDVTWQPAGTLSAYVNYKIYAGTTLLNIVGVDQQSAPSGATYDGSTWQSLGSFPVSGTLLTVAVANASMDGQVCADAIRILPAYQPTPIINNGYPGSWVNSTGWTTINQGLDGDALVSNTANGSKASQAAWWFPCQPGQYEVDVTWQSGSKYSQSVGFDVYNGGTYPGAWIKTCTVNEQNAPVGVTDQGVVWQSLGVFTMTTDVLHVSLWNSETDGAICVDGVRIVPVGVSASQAEPASSAAMVVAAPVTSAPPVTATASPAPLLPSASGGWFSDLAADSEPTSVSGLSQSSLDEGGTTCPSAVPLKAVDPKVVDQVDLPSLVDQESLLGIGDLGDSLDLLMSDQLGAGVHRLL
jgi:hypothetical protein